jgi:hypothetical protein
MAVPDRSSRVEALRCARPGCNRCWQALPENRTIDDGSNIWFEGMRANVDVAAARKQKSDTGHRQFGASSPAAGRY